MLRIRLSLRVRAQIRRAAAWQRTQMAASKSDRQQLLHTPIFDSYQVHSLTKYKLYHTNKSISNNKSYIDFVRLTL